MIIDIPLMLSFLAAATVLTVIPGTDTALMLRSVAVGGRRAAAQTGLGIIIGLLIWGLVVSLGLGAVLKASELAYEGVKWAGAAYLTYLGVLFLFRPREAMAQAEGAAKSISGSAGQFLRKGFLTNMLNPKIGVFYITFLPQFVPSGASVAAYSLFLALIHCAMTVLWFVVLTAAALPLSHLLKKPATVKVLDRITGCLFIAFGLRLALSRAD